MDRQPQAPARRVASAAWSSRDQRRPPRERLLSAATRLFYRHGITAVGVDAIVAEADVARMSLYRQFGSKDDLVAACLERLDRRYHQWFVEQVGRRSVPARERLVSAFDVIDEWITSEGFRGCAFINAAVELADPEHPAHAAVLAHKDRDRSYLQALAAEAGADDPAGLGRKLMLLLEGAIVTALVQGDHHAARDARAIAELLVYNDVPSPPNDTPPAHAGS